MAINKEVTFVDSTTVVDAAWLNLLQEHLAGLATLEVDTPTATQVRVLSGDDNAVSSVYIHGLQRFRDTNATFNFTSEPSGTYGVFVTAPEDVSYFSLAVTNTVPAVTPYRKIAEVVWGGSSITSVRMFAGANLAHAHTPLDGSGIVGHADFTDLTAGDPHSQYVLPSGARGFSAPVGGVTPSADSHLATKGYIDGISVPGLPIGVILPWPALEAQLPGGWLICNGSSYAVATYPALHAVIGDTYGGDGGTNFNLPDARDRFVLGKAAAGTGSTLGEKGGSRSHTHTQPTHTHTDVAHTHTTSSHSHTTPTSGTSATHNHTQGSTGTSATHTHSGPSHNHSGSSFSVNSYGKEVIGSEHGSSTTKGVFGEDALDASSSSTSHRHGPGTYSHSTYGSVCGYTDYNSASHSHLPSGNSYEHTHIGGVMYGTVAYGGTGSTGSGGAHTHTNQTLVTAAGHTHSGAATGTAAPTTNSGGGGVTSASGSGNTGSADAPHMQIHYIIRAV